MSNPDWPNRAHVEGVPGDLAALNVQIGDMEQAGDAGARQFFEQILSEGLIFRRASGKTDDRDGFLATLAKNPFASRRSEEISVTERSTRALVTLLVVSTRADDNSVHEYRNIRLFARREQGWVLEFWYNYELTGI